MAPGCSTKKARHNPKIEEEDFISTCLVPAEREHFMLLPRQSSSMARRKRRTSTYMCLFAPTTFSSYEYIPLHHRNKRTNRILQVTSEPRCTPVLVVGSCVRSEHKERRPVTIHLIIFIEGTHVLRGSHQHRTVLVMHTTRW